MKNLPLPIVEQHGHITVVRDDLIPGGTKTRYLIQLFERYGEVVYASPAYGGAQVALAHCAALTGKRATIFTAKRATPHQRTLQALHAGARVFQVPYGYLSVVQARARKYADDYGAYLLPFGADLPEALDAIARAALTVRERYGVFDECWSACGSGTLIRGLQQSGLATVYHAVQVGRPPNAGNAYLHKHPLRYEQESRHPAPFPSCPNYDRKAWQVCQRQGQGRVLFWNVMGDML